jgi:tetratricopeptide (TPR) repeat protein
MALASEMSKVTERLIADAAQHRRQRELADAAREWAEAVELSRQQNDIPTLIRALRGGAETERDLGRNGQALASYEEAVLLCRKQSDALLLAHTVRHLGDVRRHLGDHEDAQSCYEEALGIYRREPGANPLDVANALRPFAILREKMGDFDGARAFWREARELYESLGIDAGVTEASQALAHLSR